MPGPQVDLAEASLEFLRLAGEPVRWRLLRELAVSDRHVRELTDLVGLDVRLAISEHLHRELGTDTFRPPQILRRLVRAGKLGKKTGEGFYRYS